MSTSERFTDRYRNRNFFIGFSIDTINATVAQFLNSSNQPHRFIEERIWTTGDTIVDSKETERWIKTLRKTKSRKVPDEVWRRLARYVDTSGRFLLVFNACIWKLNLLHESKSIVRYRANAAIFKSQTVLAFTRLKGKSREDKARRMEKELYNKLLHKLFTSTTLR